MNGLNFHDEMVSQMNKTHLLLSAEQIAEIRSDERSKTITELESRLLNIKYNDESVFEFVSVDSILKMLEQMKGEKNEH